MTARSELLLLFVAIATATTGCDQATKFQAVSRLTAAFDGAAGFGDELRRFLATRHPAATAPVSLVDGFWEFRYVENPGASFSMMRDAPQAWRTGLLLAIAGVMMVMLVVGFRREAQDPLAAAGYALVFGGALGNFIDRARLTYVIDFIHWHWRDRFDWPVFNVADAAICMGVALLLLRSWQRRPRPAVES